MTITNLDKHGNVVSDLSKVVVPEEIELELLQILNPGLVFEGSEIK